MKRGTQLGTENAETGSEKPPVENWPCIDSGARQINISLLRPGHASVRPHQMKCSSPSRTDKAAFRGFTVPMAE
jgi:hypothetical protein